MKRNFWFALLAFAIAGLSFAGPMMMPGGMGGGPEQAGEDTDSSATATAFAGAGPGLPIMEVGIGLAILAAGYWWFEMRGGRKRAPMDGEGEPTDEEEQAGHD